MERTCLPVRGGLRIGSIDPPLPWLKIPCCLSGMPVCSKETPSASPLFPDSRPCGVFRSPKCCPVAVPAACREEVGDILTDISSIFILSKQAMEAALYIIFISTVVVLLQTKMAVVRAACPRGLQSLFSSTLTSLGYKQESPAASSGLNSEWFGW